MASKVTHTGEPSWRWRRIMAFGIVMFCVITVWGLGLLPPIADTRVNDNIVSSCFWLLGIIFMLYGGYSTAQDVAAIVAMRTGRPYADNVNTTQVTTQTTSSVVGDPAVDKIVSVDQAPIRPEGP